MVVRLFVQCPQCQQYFPYSDVREDNHGGRQFPLHTCYIGSVPVPNTLVAVLDNVWREADQWDRIAEAVDEDDGPHTFTVGPDDEPC